MITFLCRHYLLHQEKQREIKKNNSRMSKRTSADWGSRVKRKKNREFLRLVAACDLTARQRGHRNGSEERKALTCEKGEAVVVLVGWVACFCGFGRGARHKQPWPSFVWQAPLLQAPAASACLLTRLLEVEPDEIDEPFELGRRSSESDDYYSYSYSPTGHRLTAVYVTPDEHGHQSGGRTPLKFN